VLAVGIQAGRERVIDPKSLELIEASVNISVEVKTVKSSSPA
jgi:hypothetical protein